MKYISLFAKDYGEAKAERNFMKSYIRYKGNKRRKIIQSITYEELQAPKQIKHDEFFDDRHSTLQDINDQSKIQIDKTGRVLKSFAYAKKR